MHKEIKLEFALKIAPWLSTIIALLALKFNIKSRKEDLGLRLKDQQYKDRHIFFESKQSWNTPVGLSKPNCLIRITNRDSRDITVREITWAQVDNCTTWQSVSIQESPQKLQSSDFYEFEVDADEIMHTVFLNSSMSDFTIMEYIAALRMQVTLSTGENKAFMVGPYLQFYLLSKYVKSSLVIIIGRYIIKRAHNKELKSDS